MGRQVSSRRLSTCRHGQQRLGDKLAGVQRRSKSTGCTQCHRHLLRHPAGEAEASKLAPVVVPRNGHVHAVPVQQPLQRVLQLRAGGGDEQNTGSVPPVLAWEAQRATMVVHDTGMCTSPCMPASSRLLTAHLESGGLLSLITILVRINVHGPVGAAGETKRALDGHESGVSLARALTMRCGRKLAHWPPVHDPPGAPSCRRLHTSHTQRFSPLGRRTCAPPAPARG